MPGLPKVKKDPVLDNSRNTLGERLARLRKERGLTQKDVADSVGGTRTVITDYECGRIRLYDEMLARLSVTLSCPVDMLLGLSPLAQAEYVPRLRYVKRIWELEKLPEPKQKLILKMIDDLIKANSSLVSDDMG